MPILAQTRAQAFANRGSSRRHFALAVIATTQLMLVLDSAVVNIALPSMQAELGLSDATLSWTVSAYIVAFGGFLLIGGRAGDLFGRRRVFIAGMAVFTAASLAGGFAQSGEWLVASRAAQGVGAAFASPTALALISTTFEAGRARNRALAVYSAASGAGTAVGVILGGLLTGYLSWRAVMFINIPVGIAAVVGARLVLVESARRPVHVDWWGAALGSLGVAAAVYAITESGEAERGWSDPAAGAAAVAAALLLCVFLAVEASHRFPVLPLRVFGDRSRSAALVAVMLLGFSLSMTYFQSLFVQQVLGYTPTAAGLAFVPTAVGLAVGSWAAARLLAWMPVRAVSGAGILLGSLGVGLMSRWDASAAYAPDVLAPVLMWALGTGMAFVPLTLAVVGGVHEREVGAVSAVMGMLQQVGGAVGLAVLVTAASRAQEALLADAPERLADALTTGEDAVAAQARDAIAAGGNVAFVLSAAAMAIAAVLVVCFVRGGARGGHSQ